MENRKAALVTGGSRGIGRAVSKRLASDGYYVLVNYRSGEEEALKTVEDIKSSGGSAEVVKFDVADRSICLTVCEELSEKFDVEVLVLSAGIHQDELMIFMNEDQWDSVLDVNLKSLFNVVKPVMKKMMLNRSGRIIAISSTSGESGMAGQVNYSASKAGLIGAVKSLALEGAKRGVLVNAVTPGFIQTDMTEEIDKKRIKESVPLKRAGKAEEVASVVSFLASSEASYVTGQVIGVNGGVYM